MTDEIIPDSRHADLVERIEHATGQPSNLLREAEKLVLGDRMDSYGHPADNFDRLRPFLEAVYGVPVSDTMIACTFICLKMARELTNHHRDNLVDVAGYVQVLDLVNQRREA